jgi:hypothetical protein
VNLYARLAIILILLLCVNLYARLAIILLLLLCVNPYARLAINSAAVTLCESV